MKKKNNNKRESLQKIPNFFSRETESVSKMETQEKQIQIRLKTTQDTFAVPDSTLSVPQNVNPDKLNKLVHNLLQRVESVPDFEFFISDDLLRSSLGEFFQRSWDRDQSLSNT